MARGGVLEIVVVCFLGIAFGYIQIASTLAQSDGKAIAGLGKPVPPPGLRKSSTPFCARRSAPVEADSGEPFLVAFRNDAERGGGTKGTGEYGAVRTLKASSGSGLR